MQKLLKFFLPLILLLILVLEQDSVFGQCAMCKAVATSNIENESNNVGKGLNTGILYLMAVPYLLLMGMFYLFFKDKINEKFMKFKASGFKLF
ncbi:MAG: hypothetical protein H0V01_01395 [Bacteroidetes bacterium]|nr:hypothetical protein [Bacteroidota bacterium]HET6243195.1 hypothetical protein [Bacteroidia bacterium]